MALGSTIAGTWYPGTEREIRALAKKWETAFGEAPSPLPRPRRQLLM
ncbi:MAG: hypothetical protein IKJ89_05195 [Kiritimatiellae bacterium]|nr:hypothetical protein [Kiritimatiellia bacterium]